MINVVIFDDQKLFLQSLSYRISEENDMQVLKTFESLHDVEKELSIYQPDIILMDIYLKDEIDYEMLKKIKDICESVKIILLSSNVNENNIKKGIALGADSVISKDIEAHNFIEIIRNVYQGRHVFDENVFDIIQQIFKKEMLVINKIEVNKQIDFSQSELKIIREITKGKSTAEIADKLHYSVGTVKNYISKINKKMNTEGKTGIMLFALKNDLI